MDSARLKQILGEDAADENNSGTGGEPPPEALDMGFCWPALVFGWWFAAAHSIPPRLSLEWILAGFLALASSGYREAWRHKRFDSLEHFQRSMANWNLAAKVWAAVVVCIFVAVILTTGH